MRKVSIKAIFMLLLLCIPIFAHKLNIFYIIEKKTLFVESYFRGGGICKECDLLLLDENKNEIFKSKLGAEGKISIDISNLNPKEIKVDASMGHVATLEIVEDLDMGIELEERKDLDIYKILVALGLIAVAFALFALLKRKR